MCLILFSQNDHPVYKLILAANRDEFYARRTAPSGYWPEHPWILGGRDLEAGGTWMAITLSGKLAMITNYRDPKNINPDAPTRGKLVSDYLIGSLKPHDYLKSVESHANAYNGFNLLVGDVNELYYLSNYDKGIQKIQPGLHGISNHLLETPWPKVVLGKEKLKTFLSHKKINPEQLLDGMYDDHLAPDDRLPDTGIGAPRERALSSMFIKTADYGTRCSTVLLVDKENNVVYAEREYDPRTFDFTTRSFQFVIPAIL